jgi:RNA polymerase sigma factor (sigma-70 family)
MTVPTPAERTELILSNRGLAAHVARRYRGAAIDLDDLVQEGMLGLIRASRDFDPAKGTFATHAVPWVRAFVRRAVRRAAGQSARGDLRLTVAPLGDDAEKVPDRPESDDLRPALLVLALERLHPVEAWALSRRFGLDGRPPATYPDLAAESGQSLHRLRQIVQAALDRMRELLEGMGGEVA